jgi:hypothetical protein
MAKKKNAVRLLLDFLVAILGGTGLLVLFTTGIMCSLAALLVLASESRLLFQRTSRAVGVLVLVFGLLLPFRESVSSLGTLLCAYWAVVLFHIIHKAEFIQGISAVVLSIVFWTINARNENSLLQIVGDMTVFVILPSVFTVVYLSRGFDLLGEKPRTGGPVIPLQKWLMKARGLLGRLIPPER